MENQIAAARFATWAKRLPSPEEGSRKLEVLHLMLHIGELCPWVFSQGSLLSKAAQESFVARDD
jgi:hypothetical protein